MKIVLSTIAALLLLGCSDSTKENTENQVSEVVQKSKEVAQNIKESATKSAVEAQEKSAEIVEGIKESAKKSAVKIQEKSAKVVKDVSEGAAALTKKAQTKSSEVAKEVEKSVEASRAKLAKAIEPKKEISADGATIFKACASCHGVNAEKKALNKSQIIQGWEASKIVTALHGYKDGSYGGPMKGIMKPQASKLSDAEIDAVAKYISGLKK